jgi:hypothetical protein
LVFGLFELRFDGLHHVCHLCFVAQHAVAHGGFDGA